MRGIIPHTPQFSLRSSMNPDQREIPNPFVHNIFAVVTVLISLVAISLSFVLASSALSLDLKTTGFAGIVATYLLVCLLVHAWQTRKSPEQSYEHLSESDIDLRLRDLEEACQFMGGSLNSADMFRLLSNKTGELFSLQAFALLLVDRGTNRLRLVQTYGDHASELSAAGPDLEAGIAGRSLGNGMVHVDRSLSGGRRLRSSAAIPLKRNGDVFAIYQLYSDSETAFDGNSVHLLEAIGERVSPLILTSISFDRSLSNALTDPITDLPNERAFHLVLENQIAETQRDPEGRPLAILAIDIKEFDEINVRFGHASGERILGMVAAAVKGQLREMDFFARSTHDEFLAILPTATQQVAEEIIVRINTGLFSSKFFVTDTESIAPELNFGVATFGADGETAGPLIRAARLRKQQTKTTVHENVLWFPKEFVN